MSNDDFAASIVQRFAQAYGDRFSANDLDVARDHALSAWFGEDIQPTPIEQLLATAICLIIDEQDKNKPDGIRPVGWANEINFEASAVPGMGKAIDAKFVIAPQVKVGGIRLDFAGLSSISSTKVAIECDGHDFHDRTKHQASWDRARDRALQKAGWIVFRYTGSDIWRDPINCAEDVIMYLNRVATTPTFS